ncbi:MAG: M2 family metallopeptidase [Planctomycetota bacterium]
MKSPLLLLALLPALACARSLNQPPPERGNSMQKTVQVFLDDYQARYQQLYYAWNKADWEANTRIVEGDDSRVKAADAARSEYALFTGAVKTIETVQRFLRSEASLTPLQVRQLKKILYLAAANPQTVPELVSQLIEAEGKQVQDLYGFNYKIGGKRVTTNGIDRILRESNDLQERRRAWEASKEVGVVLKEGLARLRDLRNGVVQALGYPDFYTYQVSDYGMTSEAMNAMMDRINRELRPLYRELHTWARYELARRFGQPVPDQIPADWLPNRWAQDWSPLVEVEGVDLDSALQGKDPEWIVKQGEAFYVSMGFPRLPKTFWERSSLFPVPADAPYKKNNHASAWHLDLDRDVRSLMSIEPNAEWYETAHHELGHIFYFLSYSNPHVPLLLRAGANRAFHEAIGSMMGLAAMQRPFLAARGLIPRHAKADKIQLLLREALAHVVFLSFGAGTMPGFEHALYAERLPTDRFNAKWWELVRRYQGVVPPAPRGEEFADGLSKTHINDDPAQYYDYALSTVLLFQIHDHIAREILHEDPRETNYFGNREVGRFLRGILSTGANRDWRELIRESTGSDLSAKPMLDYFAPLLAWLKEQNRGRTATLPEL